MYFKVPTICTSLSNILSESVLASFSFCTFIFFYENNTTTRVFKFAREKKIEGKIVCIGGMQLTKVVFTNINTTTTSNHFTDHRSSLSAIVKPPDKY